MAVLIGGGTGFIGRSLAQCLRDKNRKVFIVTRSPKKENEISWSGIKDNGLPDGVGTVINLAGRNVGEMSPLYMINKYYKSYKHDIFDSRLSTTKLLAHSIRLSLKPPNLFINSSAIGFYRPSLTEIYTESSPFIDHDIMTDLCHQWESAATIADKPNIKQIQIRTGLVLGSGGGMLASMYLPYKLGLGGHIGTGKQWMSWIHIDDMIGLILFIMDNSQVTSGPINATAPQPVTNKEFSTTLGIALHRPTLLPMTSTMVKILFRERAALLLEGQRVIPKRLIDYGYKFKYEHLSDALAAIYN